MLIFTPLIYLAIGLMLGRVPYNIKAPASALLTKIIIPLVIIFNIITNRPGVYSVMFGMMIMMLTMLFIARFYSQDPIHNLCFCYINIGWLGLPIVSAASVIFGEGADAILIAAYVGSSLFGNSVGVGLLVQQNSWLERVKSTLCAPPVWVIALGILLIPYKDIIVPFATPIYAVLKVVMGFFGMAILGMWLSNIPLKKSDFIKAITLFGWRGMTFLVLLSLFLVCSYWLNMTLVTDHKIALYLLCLLPPSANIIVLETHYQKSGRSASMIAAGTCISLVAICVYVAVIYLFSC